MGAFMFSVPPDAAVGPHQVAIENFYGRSASTTFTVQPQIVKTFPNPRVDYVTLLGAAFDSKNVTPTLYVQGANIDVGAIVFVDDAPVATTAHKVLLTDWHGVSAADMDYPIFHYASAIAVAGAKTAGATIQVKVKNLDGTFSQEFPYKLPPSAALMDSDGDGLLDSWETHGYDANDDGVIDVDLPALGADPYRRDVFVQLDIMDNVQHRPGTDVFDGARAMFAAAPIINPFTTSGINLILEVSGKPCLKDTNGDSLCSFQNVNFDTGNALPVPTGPIPVDATTVNFSRLKANNFDNAKRGQIYHYGIWGIRDASAASGQSDFADDFLVSFDDVLLYPASYQTVRSQIEELTHELGHDLRLHHGGEKDYPLYSPNYWSVMSYAWDLRTGFTNADRQARATCLPFYYGAPGADEVGGAVPSPVSTVVDYSAGMAKKLQSGAPSAICDNTVSWEAVWQWSDGPTSGTLKDFANWRALQFDGPSINGWPTAADGIQP
jgi:hypothetical protein